MRKRSDYCFASYLLDDCAKLLCHMIGVCYDYSWYPLEVISNYCYGYGMWKDLTADDVYNDLIAYAKEDEG